ncbi:unnamed protein product [Penicillium olsonii]|nr:unnamed protein product [Penicillium olsonii]CAG7932452.1 unnamed protein product [Penicillium olsonii]
MPRPKGDKKPGKKDGKNTQSHIRARIDYLHQAAVYLQAKSSAQQSQNQSQAFDAPHQQPSQGQRPNTAVKNEPEDQQRMLLLPNSQKKHEESLDNISRTCVSHLRDVAMKTQIRLPVTLKRSLCKRCATLLTPGVTCSHEIRNESRGGKKPWADVLIVRCLPCGAEKRFPQTEKRSKKLNQRRKEGTTLPLDDSSFPLASGG